MVLFEDGALVLKKRKTVNMLRCSNVIHRGPASFCCMIHAPVSLIISVIKKKVLVFNLRV